MYFAGCLWSSAITEASMGLFCAITNWIDDNNTIETERTRAHTGSLQ